MDLDRDRYVPSVSGGGEEPNGVWFLQKKKESRQPVLTIFQYRTNLFEGPQPSGFPDDILSLPLRLFWVPFSLEADG